MRGSNDLDCELRKSLFNLLRGQYDIIVGCLGHAASACEHAACVEAQRILKFRPEDITWDDIYCLERAILELEPLPNLRAEAWSLRNQLKHVGDGDFDAFETDLPPGSSPDFEKQFRAFVVKLREWASWTYTARWILEEFRDRLTCRIACLGGIFVALFLGLTMYSFSSLDDPPGWVTLLTVALAGIAGGFVSTFRRVQTAQLTANTDLALIENERGFARSVLLSPFLGAIFATILYAFFASGFLKGSLFPNLPFDTGFALKSIPTAELAKLLIWSFIAGFAEKFVPDRLDQITEQAGPKKGEPIDKAIRKVPGIPPHPDGGQPAPPAKRRGKLFTLWRK